MAEENQELEQQQDQERGEEPTDWKAKYEEMRSHSRDWEKKAKENLEAVEELKEQQMSEQEKATARAEKAESELAEIKARADRLEKAQQVSEETGVPLALLQYCDVDDMESFAESYMKEQPEQHSAPRAVGSKIVKGSGEKLSNADLFAQTASQLFK